MDYFLNFNCLLLIHCESLNKYVSRFAGRRRINLKTLKIISVSRIVQRGRTIISCSCRKRIQDKVSC